MDPCVCVCAPCEIKNRVHDRCRHLFCIIRKRGGKKESFPTVFETLFGFFFFSLLPFRDSVWYFAACVFSLLSSDLSTDPFFFFFIIRGAFPIQGGGGWKRLSLFLPLFLHESRWKLKGCLGGALDCGGRRTVIACFRGRKAGGRAGNSSSSLGFAKTEYNFITFYRFDPRYTLLSLRTITPKSVERERLLY